MTKGNFGSQRQPGQPHQCQNPQCVTCRLFGVGASERVESGPCRLVVRDCIIAEEDPATERVKEQSQGLPFTEEKTETAIDRITGAAKGTTLRKTERVPAGVAFALDLSLRVMDTDDEAQLLETLKDAMRLLEKDALGGSGSRGYGKIRFEQLTLDGQAFTL
ncbi:MAG: hypothetical protein BWY76_00660 [bacterium ADurb.Bin429]|nr:MAG: hypothetical protein BWY76_00660 [bacterium ADurb.Bin429]